MHEQHLVRMRNQQRSAAGRSDLKARFFGGVTQKVKRISNLGLVLISFTNLFNIRILDNEQVSADSIPLEA